MKKKTFLTLFNLSLGLLAGAPFAGASDPMPGFFTYQGKLDDGNRPATGLYDMTFRLYASAAGNDPVSAPFTTNALPVTNGVFSVPLDFGAAPFNGEARWLQISVRASDPANQYVMLVPRWPLAATPYSFYALKAGSVTNGAITAAQLAPSAVGSNQVANYSINAAKIANGTVVRSLNGLKDDVTLTSDGTVTVTPNPNGNTIQLSASGGVFSRNGSSAYYNGGNIGIGTSSPEWPLDVRASQAAGRFISSGTINGAVLELRNDTPGADYLGAINFNDATGSYSGQIGYHADGDMTFRAGGVEAMRISGSRNGVAGYSSSPNDSGVYGQNNGQGAGIAGRTSGTGSAVHGDNPDPNGWAGYFNGRVLATGGFLAPWGPILTVPGGPNTRLLTMRWDGINGDRVDLEVPGATANNALFSFTANGNLSVGTLTIRGGADLAEPFQMSEEKIAKGSVVVIDEERPGRLKQAARAYDTRVAGIVSGANGINAGIQLHQEGLLEGSHNVALSGRVYALADASNGSIEPGDLLTSSHTLGHCMKVTEPSKAHGAIIGKAMSALANGKGMVLVLVSLQ